MTPECPVCARRYALAMQRLAESRAAHEAWWARQRVRARQRDHGEKREAGRVRNEG